jgi:hypothetical protein
MNPKMIFIPVLVQIFITIYAYILLKKVKSKAVEDGLVDQKRRKLYEDAWPESVLKVNNNIRNQMQIPVLFYVLVFLTWELGAVNPIALILAGLFALSRVLHFFIHVGKNTQPLRSQTFTFGVIMVIGLFLNGVISLFLELSRF